MQPYDSKILKWNAEKVKDRFVLSIILELSESKSNIGKMVFGDRAKPLYFSKNIIIKIDFGFKANIVLRGIIFIIYLLLLISDPFTS